MNNKQNSEHANLAWAKGVIKRHVFQDCLQFTKLIWSVISAEWGCLLWALLFAEPFRSEWNRRQTWAEQVPSQTGPPLWNPPPSIWLPCFVVPVWSQVKLLLKSYLIYPNVQAFFYCFQHDHLPFFYTANSMVLSTGLKICSRCSAYFLQLLTKYFRNITLCPFSSSLSLGNCQRHLIGK